MTLAVRETNIRQGRGERSEARKSIKLNNRKLKALREANVLKQMLALVEKAAMATMEKRW